MEDSKNCEEKNKVNWLALFSVVLPQKYDIVNYIVNVLSKEAVEW